MTVLVSNRFPSRSPRSLLAVAASLALATALCHVVAGPSAGESSSPQGARSKSEAAVRATSLAWDEAHNSADLNRLMQLYADSAVSMPNNRPALEGRAAIEADFREFFSAFNARHRTTIVSLNLMGDWAVERGTYEFSATPKAGGASSSETGKHIVIRKLEGGKWRIQWEIWNTDRAAPAQ